MLTDGSIVRTYKEALESGQGYKVIMESVDRPAPELSPKRKAMLVKASLNTTIA
jgi:hypothetical protein